MLRVLRFLQEDMLETLLEAREDDADDDDRDDL